MKIVDVCAFYAPKGGGVRTYIDRKLAAAPGFGHELTVIAPGPCDELERRGPGASIRWIASPAFPLDRNYRYFGDPVALHDALDAERPDMVEVSSPWRSAAMVAEWRGRAPSALIMHSDPLSAYAYRWFDGVASRETIDRHFGWFWRHLRRVDERVACVVSASGDLSRRLTDGGLCKVVTIPMGVDPGIFSPKLRDEALRRALLARCGLGPDAMLLLGAGRLAPEKRWPMIIEAASAAGCQARVGLMIVGAGRERTRLLRQIGGNPHIRLLDAVADRPRFARLMASADALIHGCEAETFCMVAAEAKASGLRLIAPDRGGASDHARGSGDIRFRSGSAADAAAAILRLFADRQRPTKCARPRTMDGHFRDLFALYEQIARARCAA
ncbi:glycosyltransferase [Sphingomonas sp. MAH-20]|uniref:Glycosyltransferase n=1 Tax=Sphingomonas horti TaxID=2682842 RepID=A0A6I4IXD1_9SPHN|nr:glycosyltransferase [Sphingomonas sp. CGMCC 1.13658]MBA2920503.1 glycosyltransferase [Sphingomonas sp. CGMCC 1.13658]MVO76755.1 glycosyltransferase [Sphingomonas horti]